jgi:demethoxyubiquinone hydroxylase (CLK1/Coq7/Cat5 family)
MQLKAASPNQVQWRVHQLRKGQVRSGVLQILFANRRFLAGVRRARLAPHVSNSCRS